MPDKYQSAEYFRKHREEQRENKSNYSENDHFAVRGSLKRGGQLQR